MIDQKIFQRVSKRIDSYLEEMVELQCQLTAIPALSPENGGDGEYEKSRLILQYLRNLGFPEPKELNAPDGRVSTGVRPNIIVTLPGHEDDRTIWVLTHMDVVPPGEERLWSANPYKAYLKEDRLYGRGTEDNQQDLVASLFAVRSLLDLEIEPERNVGLIFVSDEETASNYGLKYILNSPGNPFRPSDLILVPDCGNEDGTAIEIAEKSLLWLKITTYGKQCHASRPGQGKNAFLAASHLVVALRELYKIFGKTNPLYDPQQSTFEATKKEANVGNVNTIPGEDVFYMDCRILPDYPLGDIIEKIKEITTRIEKEYAVQISVVPIQMVQAPPPTSPSAPIVLALMEAIYDVYHVKAKPVGVGAGTVAAFLRARGYPVAVWSKFTQTAHQPDEYCLTTHMLGNAKVFAHLFLQKNR